MKSDIKALHVSYRSRRFVLVVEDTKGETKEIERIDTEGFLKEIRQRMPELRKTANGEK